VTEDDARKIIDILAPLGAYRLDWEGQFAKVTFRAGYEKNAWLFEGGMEVNGIPIEPVWEKPLTMREEIKRAPILHAAMGVMLLIAIGFLVFLIIQIVPDLGVWTGLEIAAAMVIIVGGYTALMIWLQKKARNSTRVAYRNLG
jgi:hypothetical protein